MGFTSQGIAVPRLNRAHHNLPSSLSQQSNSSNSFTGTHQPGLSSSVSTQHHHHQHNQRHQHQHTASPAPPATQHHTIQQRQARSSSLKHSSRHVVDRYAEFSDAHYQFNNHVSGNPHRFSSSSSENSPQSSPLRASPRNSTQVLVRTGHKPHASHSRQQQHAARQQADVHQDLHEMHQPHKSKRSSKRSSSSSTATEDSPYRTSSRNTFAATGSTVPRRVNSNESFSFASSMKCCVGIQPKKKRSARRALAFQSQQKPLKEREKLANGGSGANWVSLSAVRSQYPSHGVHTHSASHSTVSCPYIVQATPTPLRNTSHASKHSSGYVSEIESSQSTLITSSPYESESDLSDSDFARATAGSRGKSANSVMMKLAKKFSKKNLPITQDDGDASSIGGESLGRGGSGKMKQRSSSVSNLNSLEG